MLFLGTTWGGRLGHLEMKEPGLAAAPATPPGLPSVACGPICPSPHLQT